VASLRRYLRNGGDPTRRREYSNIPETLLHVAAQYNQLGIMTALLDAGADPNGLNSVGHTPLFDAVISNHREAVRLLLKRGANHRITDPKGRTALFDAVEENYPEIVKTLLSVSTKKDVNARSKNSDTPIYLAQTPGVAALLLRKGADPNTLHARYGTPLIHFIQFTLHGTHGRRVTYRFLDLLLRYGARPNMRINRSGNTALHVAVGGEPKPRSLVAEAAIVQLLLRRGAAVNGRNANGQTPLHLAAYFGNTEQVSRLLEHPSIIVNARDTQGRTPLHYAVRRATDAHVATVYALLSHRSWSTVQTQNNTGRRPDELNPQFRWLFEFAKTQRRHRGRRCRNQARRGMRE
jgi:ankyrin repeat protein